MILGIATLSGLALFALVHTANAGCREDIWAMLKATEEATYYQVVTKIIMSGPVVQHTEQHFLDYSHFYQHIEETGIHWLAPGNQEYMSSDGENWKPRITMSSCMRWRSGVVGALCEKLAMERSSC